jgi:hypothetical protein
MSITAQLQARAAGQGDWVDELIDGKDVLIGVYKAAAGDDLTWKLPDNAWLREVTALICDSITLALSDANVRTTTAVAPKTSNS